MSTTEPTPRIGIHVHTLPADHAELVAAVQEHATAVAGPAHPVEVLDVLVLGDAVDPHTVEVLAEEYDVAEHTLLFETYAVDIASLAVHEAVH